MSSSLRMRQVHLDFHTAPEMPGVGADWDADLFIATLREAHVNSINLFAKCHHGMHYYPTTLGPVHPSLTFDLLGAQIEACHRADIRCPIYIAVGWEQAQAELHPEWRQVDIDGKFIGRSPFGEWGWPWMCVNNGYADLLVAQTEELMDRYECDGFWYDILLYDAKGCLCQNCLRDMRARGIDPRDPLHRHAHNTAVTRRFMGRIKQLVDVRLPDADLFFNCRTGLQMSEEAPYYNQLEIESLPTGGWGYGCYPLWSRFARNFGKPILGMTGRFHRMWADWGGLKHPEALKFECGGMLATGGAICIGDQMPPNGRLNPAVYRVIGEAFREVEAVEQYCIDAQPVTEVGVLVLWSDLDGVAHETWKQALEGAGKMLLELHQQFDVIDATCPDFSRYRVLVIPDWGHPTPEIAARLRAFVANGGALLVTHHGLLDETGGEFALSAEMGIRYLGPCQSNPDYFQVIDPALHGPVVQPEFPYSLYLGPSTRVSPSHDTVILAQAYETYFNRTWEHFCSHGFTPPINDAAAYPALTRQGQVIYCYGPIFSAYHQYGNLTFRALVGKCLEQLLPTPLVSTDAPSTAEVTLMRQGDRHIVHVVNYSATRRATPHVEALEAPVPLRDITVRLRDGQYTRAFQARSGLELPITDNRVIVPRVDAFELVIFE